MPTVASIGFYDQRQFTAVGHYVVFINEKWRGLGFGGAAVLVKSRHRLEYGFGVFDLECSEDISCGHNGQLSRAS